MVCLTYSSITDTLVFPTTCVFSLAEYSTSKDYDYVQFLTCATQDLWNILWSGLNSQTQHCLHGYKQGWNVERLKENLSCLLPVLSGIQGCFCQQYWMLLKWQNKLTGFHLWATNSMRSVKIMLLFHRPLQQKSVAGLWNKCTAISSPCHSSPGRCHVPLDSGWSADLGAPVYRVQICSML